MCLANVDDVIRDGLKTADEIYAEALNANPFELADKLLLYAYDERETIKRATLRHAAVLLTQFGMGIKR